MNNPLFNFQPSLTPTQVAQMLGVKPSTVRAWISRKELSAYKMGSRRYITRQQIADFYYRRKSADYVDMTYSKGPTK